MSESFLLLTANNSKEVSMSLLNTSLNFCGHQVNMKIKPLKEIAREFLSHELLNTALCELFSCFANGYLCRGLECWALFKCGEAFYVFDPLGIEVKEKKMVQRRAVLYKFDAIELMVEHLMNEFENVLDEKCEVGAVLSCLTSPERAMEKPQTRLKKPKKKTYENLEVTKPIFSQQLAEPRTVQRNCYANVEELRECIEIEDPCAN